MERSPKRTQTTNTGPRGNTTTVDETCTLHEEILTFPVDRELKQHGFRGVRHSVTSLGTCPEKSYLSVCAHCVTILLQTFAQAS
eukprot:493263-Pelagomonas_calceolata.AAC.1